MVDDLIAELLSVQTQAPRTPLELPESDIRELCTQSRLLLLSQPVLTELNAPLHI